MTTLAADKTAMFSLDGWDDAMPALQDECQKISPYTFLMNPTASPNAEESVISAPEAFDPKTDMFLSSPPPLVELLARKEIVPAKELTADETRDAVDILLIQQTQFLRAIPSLQCLSTCAYWHDASLLEGNAVLKAVFAAIKKVYVLTSIVIRDAKVQVLAEEFMMMYLSAELKQMEDSIDDIDATIAQLDELVADSASTPAALKVRLNVQKNLLSTLNAFINVHQQKQPKASSEEDGAAEEGAAAASSSSTETAPQQKFDLSATLKAFQGASHAWQCENGTEPVLNSKVFLKNASAYFPESSTPMTAVAPCTLGNAKDFLKQLHGNFHTLVGWKNQAKPLSTNFYSLMRAVKDFAHPLVPQQGESAASFAASASPTRDETEQNKPACIQHEPCLVARSVAFVFLFNANSQLLLDTKSKDEMLLHTLESVHGAPIYSHLFHAHHEIVTALANSHVNLMAQLSGQKPKDLIKGVKEGLPQQAKQVIDLVATVAIDTIRYMLMSRAIAHQQIPRLLREVSNEVRQQIHSLDTVCVDAAKSREMRMQEMINSRRNRQQAPWETQCVLTAFFDDMMLDLQDFMLVSDLSLGLLTPPELAQWNLARFVITKMREQLNQVTLYMSQDAIGTNVTATNRKSIIEQKGAGVAYRQAKVVPLGLRNTLSSIADNCNMTAFMLNALQPVVPALQQKSTSLMSSEVLFDNRIFLLRTLNPGLRKEGNFGGLLQRLAQMQKEPKKVFSDVILTTAESVERYTKDHIASKRDLTAELTATVSAVRDNKVVAGLISTMLQVGTGGGVEAALEGYEVSFEQVASWPQLVQFKLKKLTQ